MTKPCNIRISTVFGIAGLPKTPDAAYKTRKQHEETFRLALGYMSLSVLTH